MHRVKDIASDVMPARERIILRFLLVMLSQLTTTSQVGQITKDSANSYNNRSRTSEGACIV